jgi:N-glycosylase/DNA lyase
MMQAYIDASAGNVDGAELELRRAEELADPLDPFSTASAEVYLLLNRQGQVRDALQKMVERAEPSHEYILSNPIFGYLATDPTFRSVMQAISEQRTRIAAALDTIEL